MKIPLLPNNVGKKSANDAGPKQGHDNTFSKIMLKLKILHIVLERSHRHRRAILS